MAAAVSAPVRFYCGGCRAPVEVANRNLDAKLARKGWRERLGVWFCRRCAS